MNLIKKIFGYCVYCNKYFKYPKRYRMHTAYVDEESNYTIICKACTHENDAHWAERWQELYHY
jgi:hypothetical protein